MSRLLRGSLLLIAVVVAGVLLQPGFADPPKGKKYALLVGVSYYKNAGYPHLRGTENDVVELAKLLRKPSAGFEVTLLTSTPGHKNKELAPTAANIRKELDKLLKGKGREDTVLIALAGHGADVEVDDPEKDPKKKKEANTYTYFFPTDADNLEDISHSTGHSDHLIELGDVFKRLEAPKCGAGTKLVLIDACRDNFTATSSKRTTRGLSPTRATVPDGVSALFSCGPGEAALETGFDVGEEDRRIHGVFFWHVMEGLKGEARNKRGTIDWPGLTSYVQAEVPAFVLKKKFKERGKLLEQTPHAISNARRLTVLVDAEAAEDGGKKDKPAKTKVVKDKKEEKEITNGIGMKLVRIPAETFTMGSPKDEKDRSSDEGPQHEVEITKAFYMGVHEVTQEEYEKVMGKNPSRFSSTGSGKDSVKGLDTSKFPVETVSWEDAVEFCEKLTEKERKEGKIGREQKYRLPTEAEWEYSCRGPGTFPYQVYHFGDSLSSSQANFGYNLKRTTKVGSYEKNRFGLFDMHGNVWEWCQDWFDEGFYKDSTKKDPECSKSGKYRVLRGGSWVDYGRACRAAYRNGLEPGCRDGGIGFRVVCAPAARTD